MKKFYLMHIAVFVLIVASCKTEKKHKINDLNKIKKFDTTAVTPVIRNAKRINSLKEKILGKQCNDAFDIIRFDGYYIPGGFLIGSTFNNEHIVDEKIFSITRVIGEKKKKKPSTYLILKKSYSNKNSSCEIADILEIDKETDVFKRFPNKDIDVFSDVLRDGERAPELLALAEYEETDTMTTIYKVWRANRKLGKFEEVKNLSGITVVNEDY